MKPTITTLEPANNHPILKGWGTEPFVSSGSLYKVSPLHAGTQPLLTGAIPDQPAEPTAWTYRRAVDRGAVGGHSFYTSLGHADDFGNERFAKFLASAVDWLIEQK